MRILEALLIEAILSIHMSILIFKPLAEYLDPNNENNKFVQFFTIRAIILLFGNFIIPIMPIIDCIALFIGFFIVKYLYLKNPPKRNSNIKNDIKSNDALEDDLTSQTLNNTTNYKSLNDTKHKEYIYQFKDNADLESTCTLEEIGISDVEKLKRELYDVFIKYENAFSNFNYDMLKVVCTADLFKTVSTNLSSLKESNMRKIYENIELNNISLNTISQKNNIQKFTAIINITLNDYLIDTTNNLSIKGDKYSKKNKRLSITFLKNTKNFIKLSICPNCGAPLRKDASCCDYCKTSIYTKNYFKIDSIITVRSEIV